MERKRGRFISKKRAHSLLVVNNTIKSVNERKQEQSTCSDSNDSPGGSHSLPHRRIVDLDVLVSQLECDSCHQELSLRNFENEVRYGLGSFLSIKCLRCLTTKRISSGKTHRPPGSSRGPEIFDVNTKAALGMMHTGIGETHINELFSVMNIPPMSKSTTKKREREIGPVAEVIAKDSCIEVCSKTSTKAVAYDMGWQRRGSGKTYNSMSGHGCLLDADTSQVLAYGTKISTCRFCEVAQRQGRSPTKHDCRRNWAKSSKAMEPSLAVDLMRDVKEANIEVDTIIMDDDTTTIHHLRKEIDPNIQKWSDINHAKKNFTSSLYKLANSHKALSSSNNKLIKYLAKSYSYAIAQNRDKPDDLRRNLKQVVPHLYGEHENCGTWCKKSTVGDAYQCSGLPKGKPLEDLKLREELEKLFAVQQANAEKLSPCGSTKANESLNNSVASKAPKSRHYSSSQSLDFRVAATVAQKNLGKAYINRTFESAFLSPSDAHTSRVESWKKSSTKRKAYEGSKVFKKRRLELKESRGKNIKESEIKEGKTYSTGIATSASVTDTDIDQIPDCLDVPTLTTFPAEKESCVFFDLETTGFTNGECSICQVACYSTQLGPFNVYILPQTPITAHVSALTQLSLHEDILCYKGEPVTAVTLDSAMRDLLEYLKRHEERVSLVAHNCKAFDSKYIAKAIIDTNLQSEFELCVAGFLDTLPLMRQAYPNEPSHTQSALYAKVIQTEYDSHNAAADCKALQELFDITVQESSSFDSYTMSYSSVLNYSTWEATTKDRATTFQRIVTAGKLTKAMATKCAGSGLTWGNITTVAKRDGEQGLTILLSALNPFTGKPRVTKSKKIINNISIFLGIGNDKS